MACETVSGSAGEPAALVSARLGDTRATARPVTTAAMRRRGMTTGKVILWGGGVRWVRAPTTRVGRWLHERGGPALDAGSAVGLTFASAAPGFGRPAAATKGWSPHAETAVPAPPGAF